MLLAVVVECAEARTAILALSQNDQPLSEEDGPFRIVMAGETHRARWARQVERIRVVRVGN